MSSSAHVMLLRSLLGASSTEASADKALDVALHAGSLGALLVSTPVRRPGWMLVTAVPAAAAGFVLEGPIESRLRGRRVLAGGLTVGALALVAADSGKLRTRVPVTGSDARSSKDAGWADAVWIGLAQALALVPGLSRLGITMAAARARGFSRPAAFELGTRAGLPIVAGAVALKGARVGQAVSAARRVRSSAHRSRSPDATRGAPVAGPDLGALAAGAGSAFLATLAARPLANLLQRGGPLWPWAAYRCGVAAAVLLLRDNPAR